MQLKAARTEVYTGNEREMVELGSTPGWKARVEIEFVFIAKLSISRSSLFASCYKCQMQQLADLGGWRIRGKCPSPRLMKSMKMKKVL